METMETQKGKIAITRLVFEHGELQEIGLFKKVNTLPEVIDEYILLVNKWALIRQAEKVNVIANFDEENNRLSITVCGVTYIYNPERILEQ